MIAVLYLVNTQYCSVKAVYRSASAQQRAASSLRLWEEAELKSLEVLDLMLHNTGVGVCGRFVGQKVLCVSADTLF